MSNLIKSRYVFVKEEDKKIIDSNNRIEELKSIYNALNKTPQVNLAQTVSEQTSPGEFVEGLHFQVVETTEEEEALEELIVEDPEHIINEAKLEAEKILEEARVRAREESAKAIEKASQLGFEEGFKKATAECNILKEELQAKAEQMDAEFALSMQKLEPEFAELVSLLVENITGIYVQDKKDVILHLLHKAMIHADKSKEYHIKVSEEDYERVLADRENLVNLVTAGCVLEIGIDKGLEKNQCQIDTDTGIIDCSLDVQLEALKQDLKLLSMQTE